MARTINPAALSGMIQKLQQERQKLQGRLDQIDQIFAECGISAVAAAPVRRGPGRPPGSGKVGRPPGRPAGRRKRGKFATSGVDSILKLVKEGGKAGVASALISKHWKAEGRAGEPFVTLGHLCKSGKLKKKSIAGQRGSTYFAA